MKRAMSSVRVYSPSGSTRRLRDEWVGGCNDQGVQRRSQPCEHGCGARVWEGAGVCEACYRQDGGAGRPPLQGRALTRIQALLSMHPTNKPTYKKLDRLKDVMRRYIASPWDPEMKRIMDTISYEELKDKARGIGIQLDTLCQQRLNDQDPGYPYKQKLCQSHAGNLLQHSQWSALQILKWGLENDEVMEGVDLETAIVAAFFHDIGKGGDCISTCTDRMCWFDMYAEHKYDKKGELEHIVYSGDMLLGKRMFKADCDGCKSNCTIDIRQLIQQVFRTVDVNQVALAAYMHYAFGELNKTAYPPKPQIPMDVKISAYFTEFVNACHKCDLEPTLGMLKLCIAVSSADITAGTNRRLLPDVHNIKPEDETFLSKDPWTDYEMDKKYLGYRNMLLQAYTTLEPSFRRPTRVLRSSNR